MTDTTRTYPEWQKAIREAEAEAQALRAAAEAKQEAVNRQEQAKRTLALYKMLGFCGIDGPFEETSEGHLILDGYEFSTTARDAGMGKTTLISLTISVRLTQAQIEALSDYDYQTYQIIESRWCETPEDARRAKCDLAYALDWLDKQRVTLMNWLNRPPLLEEKPEQIVDKSDPFVVDYLQEVIRQAKDGTLDYFAGALYAQAALYAHLHLSESQGL